MEILGGLKIAKMFDSIILEEFYGADYTTIFHCDCDFTFGGQWKRKYSYSSGYTTGAKYFTCPNCGKKSNPWNHKVLIMANHTEVVPIDVYMDVVNYKDFLDFRIKYTGVQLDFNGKKREYKNQTEILRFDFKKKAATFIDRKKVKHELTTNWIREHEFMPVLKHFSESYAMHEINKKYLLLLYKTLRTTFEKRIKETYGYRPKDVYLPQSMKEFNGYGISILLNMVLKLAAPDMPNIKLLVESDRKWSGSYGFRDYSSIPFSENVLNKTRQGMSFLEALRMAYKGPDSKSLRRRMIKDPMCVKLSKLLNLFKDENNRRTLLEHEIQCFGDRMDYLDRRPKDVKGIYHAMLISDSGSGKMWRKVIARFGEPAVVRFVINTETQDTADIVEMYKKLKPESIERLWGKKFKLKDLHDVVANEFNQQEYGACELPAIPSLQADVNGMHFMVPRTVADLMTVGKRLRNCVGSYRDRVSQGRTAIVVVADDDMKPIACLELSKTDKEFDRLVQAKVFGNQRISKNKSVTEAVLKWAGQLKIEPHTIDVDASVV